MSRPFSTWDVYKAIADPNRRIVLDLLARGEQPVSAIQLRVTKSQPALSQPALSQHLKVLRDVGLVQQRRQGRERIYRLNPKPLEEVSEWIKHYERFWSQKLDALGAHLERKHGARTHASPSLPSASQLTEAEAPPAKPSTTKRSSSKPRHSKPRNSKSVSTTKKLH